MKKTPAVWLKFSQRLANFMTKQQFSVFNLYLHSKLKIKRSSSINKFKKMKSIFLIGSTVLFVVACSPKKNVKTSTISTSKAAPTTVQEPVIVVKETPKTATKAVGIPKDVDANLLASLHRSPCFGRCPSFAYELYADGKVVYHGYAYAARMGNFTAKVENTFMKRIADKALSIKYLFLSDRYPTGDVMVADLPTTTTYIRIGNDGKKIFNNYDPPRELAEFEQWLEAQFETLNWQAVKE